MIGMLQNASKPAKEESVSLSSLWDTSCKTVKIYNHYIIVLLKSDIINISNSMLQASVVAFGVVLLQQVREGVRSTYLTITPHALSYGLKKMSDGRVLFSLLAIPLSLSLIEN